MDRKSPGEESENIKTITTTTTTTTTASSAAITMATVRPSTPTYTPAHSTSLSIVPSDRQAVQVIQQAIQRPQTMAAQYLHQMYAAQQQHLMLQTAALQQHQRTPHLQSLQATIQQASIIGRRQSPSLPSSSSGSLSQSASVSQNSITLPASPVTAQLIGRTQTSSSTAAGGTISQQAMLLGNGPANCSQAQMYLRTQMLILTPAAPVAAVQTDLPAVTSCSSLTPSSQVQSLSVRAHLPGALATGQGLLLKPSTQSQALAQPVTLPKTSICPLKASQQPEAPSDTGTEVRPANGARLTSGSQLVAPATYSPVQSHTLVKQQPPCSSGQRGVHHQLIIQQTTGVSPSHRQLQPIALRVTPDTNSTPLPLSVQRLTSAATNAIQSHHGDLSAPSSCVTISVHASSTQTSTLAATTIHPQPPPLVAAPQRRSTTFQVQSQRPPPPPPLVLPRFTQNPPSSLQRLSLRSIQALAGHVLVTEEELPVAEALVQMPYQHLPPPQTVAVDLKVHPVKRVEAPVPTQMSKANGLSPVQKKEENIPNPQRDRTPTPPTTSPKENGTAMMAISCTLPTRPVIQSPEVEEPPHVSSSNNSSTTPPPPPPPLPPPLLPTVVGPSTLQADQQAMLPDSQERRTNGEAGPDDSPLDAEQSDSSDSEMENDTLSVVDEPRQTVTDVLQCEFCGKRGYVHTFLRSKRFCSMTCVRRFNVSCTRRISMLRADRAARWGHRPMGRRGRPPGRVNGASREHFLRQAHGSYGREDTHRRSLRDGQEEGEEEREDDHEPPAPMITRLRRQAERERQKESLEERSEKQQEQQHQDQHQDQEMIETLSASDTEDRDVSSPSQWSVEQVFSYINSLPGGQDIAQEFRLQEIDGQALLLLTEDHLVSAMNLKLGPALKLCAYINTLKD